ncbi:MAG TPA: AMP-binding protein [Chthoniobacterales bacterium]|nr:AMP-binding protein [Chthoniobacterales bacterium]
MNLVQNLRHRAELQPGVPAIVDRTVRGDRVVSFVAFNRSVDFLALRLREEGVDSGHQVLLALDPSQELYLFALALLQIGAIPIIGRKAVGSSFLTEWVKNVRPQACVLSQSHWLTQHFHQQLRLIPKRLFVHAFRFESRWLRLGRFGQPIELNPDQIAWIELRRESHNRFRAWAWNQQTLARTTQRLASILRMKAGEIDLCGNPLHLLANLAAGLTSIIPVQRGVFTPTGRRRQVDKFKPNRVAAKAEFLNRYLRSSTSPLQKVFVLDAPLTSEDVEFFSAIRQHGNIELLFGREAPLASCTLKEFQSRADEHWVGNFFDDVRYKLELPPAKPSDGRSPGSSAKDSESGELLVAGDFLPTPLTIHGEPDSNSLSRNEKNETWLRTGVKGALDNAERFRVLEPVES